ncbi:MAG: citrate/2-methylcitrate synthase [Eggerthellaceae bacterium]
MLDIMLMLHAEHGGGNNSTFTCRARPAPIPSYSAYAGLSGLKGARHGGANNRTLLMTDDIKAHVADITDEGQVADYLRKIVKKEAYDRTGLIYGMGHAVYTCPTRARNCAISMPKNWLPVPISNLSSACLKSSSASLRVAGRSGQE